MVSNRSKYSPRKCTILSQTSVRGISIWPNGHLIYVSNSKNKVPIMLSRGRKNKHLVFNMSNFDKMLCEVNSEQHNISDNLQWNRFGKSISKHQFGCRFDIMDGISSCLCILTYAIKYVLIHHIIFWYHLYFLNILYFSSTPVLTSSIDVVFILSIIKKQVLSCSAYHNMTIW